MKKPELLAPAGDMEKLKYALAYGADAVYVGGSTFGLRAYAGNFDLDELDEAIQYVHRFGCKIYITVNIFAHEQDFTDLPKYLKVINELGADGAIVSDPGIFALAKEVVPSLPLHLSTQANTTNSSAVNFWMKQGVERAVLARELTLEELKQLRRKTKCELEIFVHGAMCMSYSGRCLMSNYLTGRDANKGECTQPCRWKYGIMEEKRPNEIFPVKEDKRGTYIFNSHDLCLLPYLPLLKPLEIESWKIEGRMKSPHYVASTVKVYRQAIDVLWNEGEEAFQSYLPEWYAEMDKVSHRDYSPGFLFGKPGASSHNLESSHYIRDYDFVGVCTDRPEIKSLECTWEREGQGKQHYCWIEQRGYFRCGETLEVLSPNEEPWEFMVEEMWNKDNESVQVANHAKEKLKLRLPKELNPYSILRKAKKEEKEVS